MVVVETVLADKGSMQHKHIGTLEMSHQIVETVLADKGSMQQFLKNADKSVHFCRDGPGRQGIYATAKSHGTEYPCSCRDGPGRQGIYATTTVFSALRYKI